VPHAAEHVDLVGLDLLASAAAVSALAAAQLGVDQIGVQRHTGREPFDQCQQCLAVRFAGGQVS